jgi:hypothetical protein
MILCEWDASEGHPGQSCVHLYARIISTSFISVSIFSVWCYSSVLYLNGLHTVWGAREGRNHKVLTYVLYNLCTVGMIATSDTTSRRNWQNVNREERRLCVKNLGPAK